MSYYAVGSKTIIGTRVENWEGEDLGKIEEVMINKRDGEVAYLVLSYPAIFGAGYLNKRFAVPFASIAMKSAPKGGLDYILNVDEAFLRKAPGFDESNWPDFADKKFKTSISDYYKDVSIDVFA